MALGSYDRILVTISNQFKIDSRLGGQTAAAAVVVVDHCFQTLRDHPILDFRLKCCWLGFNRKSAVINFDVKEVRFEIA